MATTAESLADYVPDDAWVVGVKIHGKQNEQMLVHYVRPRLGESQMVDVPAVWTLVQAAHRRLADGVQRLADIRVEGE